MFRQSWDTGISLIQWNLVKSEAGVLRGVHVHPRHDDYLTIVDGSATIGLRDLRKDSPTEGNVLMIDVSSEVLEPLVIPHGVAHGFLFHEPSIGVYSVSHYWDTADEVACLWSDPDLEMKWPYEPKLISERDSSAQSLTELLDEIEPHQPISLLEPHPES